MAQMVPFRFDVGRPIENCVELSVFIDQSAKQLAVGHRLLGAQVYDPINEEHQGNTCYMASHLTRGSYHIP